MPSAHHPARCALLLLCLGIALGPVPVLAGDNLRAEHALRAGFESESDTVAARLQHPLALEECVQLALQRNLQLVIARQARDAARTQIGAAYGQFLPELTLQSSRRSSEKRVLPQVTETTRSEASAGVLQKLPFGTTVAAGYSYSKSGSDLRAGEGPSVVITQPLLRDAGWRTSTSGVRDANLSAEAEEVSLEERTQQVLFDVKSAYFEILRRRKLIAVNEQAVQRDKDLLEFSKAKVEAKLATQRDVLSAEIILAQDRGRLVNAEAQHQSALDQLSEILGLRIARPLQVQDVDVELQPFIVREQVWIAKALRDNPGVKHLRLDLERSALAKQVAGNGRLPQLDLQLAYDEVRAAVSEGAAARAPIQPRERSWQGSVTLSYPLFNKPLGNAYRKASLEYEQSRRALLDVERQAVLQVRDTVRNLQRIEDRISILKKNIEGARAKVEFAKVNFQLGRASNLDITDAQKDLLNAETDSVDELVNYRVEHARLEQLLGGSIE